MRSRQHHCLISKPTLPHRIAYCTSFAAVAIAALATTAQAQTTPNLNSNNLLLPFSNLLNSPNVLSSNLQQTISINNNSTAAQRNQAIIDNTITTDTGSVVSDGLGTKLNQVYQNAINNNSSLLSPNGNIVQFFRQVNGISQADSGFNKFFFANGTVDGMAKSSRANPNPDFYDKAYNIPPGSLNPLGNPRPYQVAPNQIQNFAPSILSGLTSNPSFPSGHTTFGYTQELLFAMMVPERYQQLLTRASEYGNSRIVLGAHYPLDVIGGRILATYDVAQMLNNNPAYLNQSINVFAVGAVTTTNNFNNLFQNATTDLRNLLTTGCGTDIASCAASGSPDRFSNSAQNRSDYNFRLTYGLPSVGPTNLPPVVPDGAEVLLSTRFPYLTAAQRRDVLASTELPSGAPLDDGSGWARLNLYSAADGYGAFTNNVAVTMNAALGGFNALDSWNNNITGTGGITLGGTGTLVLTGTDTYTGPTVVNGGTLVVNGSIASPTSVNGGMLVDNGSITAPTSVNGGTLVLNGSITAPTAVNLGGTLSGTGLINASLTNGGTVAPGNPVGTLTVNGNYLQTTSGTLLAQVGQTGSSRLAIGGTANLSGTLQIQPVNGFTASFGQNFTVLSATQGVSGIFSNVLAPALPGSLFYQPIYTPPAVSVMAAQPLANFAQNSNERGVAMVLDQNRLAPDANLQNALSSLYPAEVSGGVPAGLDQLTPLNAFTETTFG
jgi:autotransporter-associated beta strand protein